MTAARQTGETQPARTALAWQRTALAVLVVGGLLARQAVVHRAATVAVPAVVVALVGLWLLGWSGPVRERAVRQAAETGRPTQDRRAARTVTAAVVLTALSALATVALGAALEVTRG